MPLRRKEYIHHGGTEKTERHRVKKSFAAKALRRKEYIHHTATEKTEQAFLPSRRGGTKAQKCLQERKWTPRNEFMVTSEKK